MQNSKIAQLVFLLITGSVFINFINAQNHSLPLNVDLLTKKIINVSQTNKTDNPYIQVFLPSKDKCTGRAVVICPGGGYSAVNMGYEGVDWANYFNQLGIAAIALKYRLPKGNCNIPILDTEAALKMLRDSSEVWNVNPNDVGIMGFSAGGHLAATIATHTQIPLKPAFQILFYPVITMDKTYTDMGSHDNFLGKNVGKEMEDLYSNEKQVTKETPPAFITFSADDGIVLPDNGINYFRALIKNNVQAALYIYPTGGHGWDFKKHQKFHKQVLSELTFWLNELK